MSYLIRAATIIDPQSTHHQAIRDILIDKGTIQRIAPKIAPGKAKVIDVPGCHVSPGWFDIYAHFCDPGEEHKEDLQSGAKAALAGGFTGVLVRPDTHPALQSKSDIDYILKKSAGLGVEILPTGTITAGANGNELSEIYDLRAAGAVAFGNGEAPLENAGVLLRALQYVKAFDGLVIYRPLDRSLADGHVNEGAMSVLLGMKGSPAISEELAVYQALRLAKYTGSRLHLAKVSTAGSVALISKAKSDGVRVSASVTAHHLLLDESALHAFEENYKVSPPLRTDADRKALIKGLKDGTIDCIVSDHSPQDTEAKEVEFEYAADGMVGLETAFGVAWKALKGKVPLDTVAAALGNNPRTLLGLEAESISEGEAANLTLFAPGATYTFGPEHLKSKSRNTPFTGTKLQGKVLGAIHGKIVHLNP